MDKRVSSIAAAFEGVADGAVVLIGGFGAVGQPNALIDALGEYGVKDLTLVANNAGWGRETGIPRLLGLGRVRKMICSFPKGSELMEELYRDHRIELELVPQGTLAERIRAAGAGIPAFYTPTGVGTRLAEGKEVRDFNGRPCLLERALEADLALIEAWQADRWGNLTYRGSGRNFNPIMATAARLTVAQVHHVVELGGIAPDAVITPGIFVDRVIPLACLKGAVAPAGDAA
jgi:3-oxoadipate CoA-transferase alpha subunit